jgi:hypothetical protein
MHCPLTPGRRKSFLGRVLLGRPLTQMKCSVGPRTRNCVRTGSNTFSNLFAPARPTRIGSPSAQPCGMSGSRARRRSAGVWRSTQDIGAEQEAPCSRRLPGGNRDVMGSDLLPRMTAHASSPDAVIVWDGQAKLVGPLPQGRAAFLARLARKWLDARERLRLSARASVVFHVAAEGSLPARGTSGRRLTGVTGVDSDSAGHHSLLACRAPSTNTMVQSSRHHACGEIGVSSKQFHDVGGGRRA